MNEIQRDTKTLTILNVKITTGHWKAFQLGQPDDNKIHILSLSLSRRVPKSAGFW